MKKILSLAIILTMFAFPIVSALTFSDLKNNLNFGNIVTDNLELVKKDSNWEVVEGPEGNVIFSVVATPWRIVQERVRVSVWGLEPKTSYQLIYYGDETHNDVWPFVTCIGKPRTTSTQGHFKSGSYKFDYLSMTEDSINQKFWVVKSSDVDCEQGKMIAWNPTSYLFETRTI